MSDDGSDTGLFPIDDRHVEVAVYTTLLGYVLILMVESIDMSFSAKLVPMLVGVPLMLLIVLKLLPVTVLGTLERYLPLPSDESDGAEEIGLADRLDDDAGHGPADEQRTAFAMVTWCIGLVVVLYLFGYYYGMPIYVFALTWYLNRDLKIAVVVTLLFVVAVTLLFVVLFEQLLYEGILGLPNPTF